MRSLSGIVKAYDVRGVVPDQLEYEVSTPAGSRKIRRCLPSELLELRKYFAGIVAREVRAEKMRNGGRPGKTYQARMYDK